MLAAAEGVLIVAYAVVGLFSISGRSPGTGVAAALFFGVYGAGLVGFAWALRRLRSWARSPIVLAQLIQVLMVWSVIVGVSTALAVAVTVVAVLVLGGIFHPASLRALAGERP